MEEILKALKALKKSDEYKNYLRNKKLFDGKSIDVFYKDVIRRVKLEYMGVLDSNNRYSEFTLQGKIFSREYKPFKDLIVGNNILGAVTKLYAELATNTEPNISAENLREEFLSEVDLQELTGEAMSIQSYGGRLLFKGVSIEKKYSIDIIPLIGYVTIKNKINKNIVDSHVVFEEEAKEHILAEIYSCGKTEYRKYKVGKDDIEEVQYEIDLTDYGATPDGLGYVKKYDGWQVVEVTNIFGRSDYVDDLVTLNRELVIGGTLTSQAFDKVANPLLQIPDGAVEYDEDGNLTVRLQDRVIVVEPEDKEVKQIEMRTKTEEWKTHQHELLDQIYRDTGTNEQAFGLNKNGTAASGEAKRRDLERTLATVSTKRDKIYAALEKVIKWGYKAIEGGDLKLVITGKDILSLGLAEKMAIAIQGFGTGIFSLESSVEFLKMSDVEKDEELKRIKSDISYRTKLIEMLRTLQEIDTEERVASYIKKQADELMKELDLDDKENSKEEKNTE